MSNNIIRDAKVSIVGPFPLPYGGVAIHIERLMNLLKDKNISHHTYDLGSKETDDIDDVSRIQSPYIWYLKYLLFSKSRITHLHTTGWRLCLIFGLTTFKKGKLIVTIHSSAIPDYMTTAHSLTKRMMATVINRSHYFITVNDEFRTSLLSSLESVNVNPDKIKTISPYLPPRLTNKDYELMDIRVKPFVDTHTPLISANAFKLHHHNGVQLYGIDMCVELCGFLKVQHPDVGLVLCISVLDEPEIFETLQRRIDELGIRNNVLILTDGVYFPPILSLSDIFVRPTNTDGDAVSIREAISLGVPAVASDVVKRPEGCITFQTRNQSNFNEIVSVTLRDKGIISEELLKIQDKEDYPILEIYDEILNAKQFKTDC